MLRLSRSVVAAAAVGLCPLTTLGAEVTRVVSSFEENKPFGMLLGVGFERTQTRSSIMREGTRGDTSIAGYQRELFYVASDARMNFDLRVGLARDVELRVGVPLVLARDETWRLAAGLTPDTSSVFQNPVCASGAPVSAACAPQPASPRALFALPQEQWATFRGGLGDVRVGLAWAAFNQARDWTKPMWVLAFDYEAPTARVLDPTAPTSAEARGSFGERTHRYTFSTALSRRYGLADPYFRAAYTIPVRGPGWYSNCYAPAEGSPIRDNAVRLAAPENCFQDPWTRSATGLRPAQTAEVRFGTGLHLGEDPVKKQSFTLDLSAHARYVGPGRVYNPLSGLLGKLLSTEDHLQLGGTVGFVAEPADFFRLTGALGLSSVTDHGLTVEELGRDLDGDGQVTPYASPAEYRPSRELNPTYDFRVDPPSRRFRAVDMNVFELRLGAEFVF